MNHDAVVDYIQEMLDVADPPLSGECCIYKVPLDLRSLNKDAYTPKVVSIGPFHHGHPRLQNMEAHKLVYCKAFLERTNATLDNLVCHIQEVEPIIRRCYSDTVWLSKEDFVKVILVDSAFILELICKFCFDEWPQDAVFSKPWLFESITSDLLLLENQLPFFVLENSFFLAFGDRQDLSFLKLAFQFFDHYNRSEISSDKITISHFTDLIRTFHLQYPLETQLGRTNESVKHLQSATELREAGVRFKVNNRSKCLLDLRFSGRVLEIPQLRVDDFTEQLLRNMVALEQCHYPQDSYITDYVSVWDFLINTSRDVDVLVEKEILVNWLGDSDCVAKLFNGLAKNVVETNFSSYYFNLCDDLKAYCRDPWHKMMATLRRDYCSTRWHTAATIAGIILLLLSLLQSVCSVVQVIQESQK